jgi:hypothetical protein
MLDTVYHNKHAIYQSMDYRIKDIDHIEFFYKDDIKASNPEARGINTTYVCKYIEKDRYFYKDSKYELGSFTHSFGMKHIWEIRENKFYLSDTPYEYKFTNDYCFEVSKENIKDEDVIKTMVDTLNQKYDKVKGFELVEKINVE